MTLFVAIFQINKLYTCLDYFLKRKLVIWTVKHPNLGIKKLAKFVHNYEVEKVKKFDFFNSFKILAKLVNIFDFSCEILFFRKNTIFLMWMEKSRFLSNKNWTKIPRKRKFFAKMRFKMSAKIHRISRKFSTKMNEFRLLIYANFVQQKFQWKY